MKRTPLDRGRTQLTRRTQLGRGQSRLTRTAPAIAGRRRPELDVPADVRAAVRLRSRGACEAPLAAACTGTATDVHHRKRRRDGGHAITNLLDLCRPCHAWAHAHPWQARPAGVIVSTYEDPATVRVLVLSRLTGLRLPLLLAADGTYLVDDTAVAGALR